MELIDLTLRHFSFPERANQLIQECRETGEEICSRDEDRGKIVEFVPADGRISWHLLNTVVQHITPDRKPVFCEWGSGLGQITLLASLIGLPATGIEIEEELVDIAKELSQQHAIPATFINGSIYPADNTGPLINYDEVELVFAYPWPHQIAKMTQLFSQVTNKGAVFVCYHGGQNYRVLQH